MKKNNSLSPKVTIIAAAILIVLIGGSVLALSNNKPNAQVEGASTQNTSSKLESQKSEINKSFQVKAINVQGKEAKDRIGMNIKDADLTNEVLVKGTPATAKGASRFLILNVELSNQSKERLIVSPLDLIRLVIEDQKRAAEIYSEEVTSIKGSVVVEPDSTKVTRIGFVLTEDIVNQPRNLQVGEINSEAKEVLTINI